jgi:hypothetical protein
VKGLPWMYQLHINDSILMQRGAEFARNPCRNTQTAINGWSLYARNWLQWLPKANF